jgi:dipeptide/tripeptide permease
VTIENTSQPVPVPFPRTIYVANGVELLERLAYYGMYIGLSNYLSDTVKFSDVESAQVIGNFGFIASLAPVPCGMIADRIQFKRSLLISFSLYAAGYLALFAFPSKGLALLSLLCIAVAGGFMKPVISGTVVRTAPPGREAEGFAIFYRMVNAGSVIGKSLAYVVRNYFGLRFTLINSMIGAIAALGTSAAAYEEPPLGGAPATPVKETLTTFGRAVANPRIALALVVFAETVVRPQRVERVDEP